ncbi:MAG: c-type cytochrome [Deltaproteobacteria bacterium]|nr:MAG: c-type cytochrome [Deltaproteobacteria bacterium]
MGLRAVLCVLVIPLMIAVVSGCAKKEEPKPEASPTTAAVAAKGEGKALFEQKCSVCHGLDRATARTETKEEWTSIIQEMQEKKADWISDEEAARILDYLASSHGK